jgi:magnesium transporter
MIGKTIQPEIQALIEARDLGTLQSALANMPPPDIAEIIEDIPRHDQAIVFRLLPKQVATDTFEHMNTVGQTSLMDGLARDDVVRIVNDMRADERTALLQELPASVARDLISRLTAEERRIAEALLGYPAESVGRLMTPDYVAVRSNWTVTQVLDAIRRFGQDSETFDVIYVVDARGKLVDDLRLRELLLADPQLAVQALMDGSVLSLLVSDDQEAAVRMFRKYDRSALPVMDRDGILIGIVTIDDVLALAEEEHTEDAQKFGGLEALDAPYRSTPLLEMVRKRAGWLIILFLSEMLTATAMGYFEDEIARAVVLALFVPLIISSGGNCGSQAATLIIRALALGEITLLDWWRVMRREIVSGFLLGSILGLIGFLRILVWSLFGNIYGPHWLLVGLTVGTSLVGVVMWGTISGSMLPFLLKRFGADPATSSAPFVATLVDVSGLVIYFSVASAILRGTIL